MWIKCYASHVLVCGEDIDESHESRIICHESSRDELVDGIVSRQDMIDMGRTHAKAGALVFHEDQDSSVMTRICGVAAALQRLGDASRLLVTSRGRARSTSLLLLQSLRFNHQGPRHKYALLLAYPS